MSEQLSIAGAREKLHLRLWAGEGALDGDRRLAIAGHRLWCALCEQRFHAEAEGRPLSAHDLTDLLRGELFSTVGLTVNSEGFTAWIAGVVPLTSPPSRPFMTAVEAVSFLMWGAFLTTEDIQAIAAQTKISGSVWIVGRPINSSWELAERQLFDAHVHDRLTLIGRRATCLSADPLGKTAPVPKEFFTGRKTLRLGNIIHDHDDRARPVYCDVELLTTEFSSAFSAPDETVPPSRDRPHKHRAPTRQDAQEFKEWARARHKKRGYGPSRKEAEEFASERHLNRNWARDQIFELPDELRRQRGGTGSAKHQSKTRAAD